VACGSPEEILRVTKSHTGQALKKSLRGGKAA
jgi:excinuclease UvrABC ATPase subunit